MSHNMGSVLKRQVKRSGKREKIKVNLYKTSKRLSENIHIAISENVSIISKNENEGPVYETLETTTANKGTETTANKNNATNNNAAIKNIRDMLDEQNMLIADRIL
ncbi:15672_t:CDS:2 [Cetraspora pellucida]|uniref:15672_t:CDS:1 n=1 Tax=Cetraspora pellucida TaxID=1433469 RepID=A0A9N9DDN3_9GLOM|nr:15672_t:CDS:2 [Cetraspora pellucida]